MSKIKKNKFKHKVHWTHLTAVVLLIIYFSFSKANVILAFSKDNYLETFMQLYVFGLTFSLLFLYIFSHDRFIPFAKEIEKEEKEKEKRYLKKYLHHGRIIATIIIGSLGGPVFSSLTARVLLNNIAYKYLIVSLVGISSTLLTMVIGGSIVEILKF